jgi:glyoxylase-like metal-dependent hydrolase (beta-lactamase superfamily II)
MRGGEAIRLPDAAGYAVWLLCVGSLDFAPGGLTPDAVTIPVNALLLRGHGETLLVDAGSGPADPIWPGAGALEPALAAAGIAPAEIDAVVLSHLDFDHCGGALAGTWPDDLRPAFPRIVLSAVGFGVRRPDEPDDWDVGTPLVAAYEREAAVEQVLDGAELRPELRLVSAPGHRPGHAMLFVGDELVYGADLLHHAAHIGHPEWDTTDADPELGLATRRTWIDRFAASGTRLAFSHLEGLGRIGPGRAWEPLEAQA